MKIEKFLSILIFIGINSIKNDSIIRIPRSVGRFENISTKNGFINYEFKIGSFGDYQPRIALYWNINRLEGIKNLDLTEFKNYKRYGKNNDSIEITIGDGEDIYNGDICKLLYQAKYIDKMIYSYGRENNTEYKYFGGTPENIIKERKLKKFTFKEDEFASKLILRIPDSYSNIYGNEIVDTLNGEGRFIEIAESKYELYALCIPRQHGKLLDLFGIDLNSEYYKCSNFYYMLNETKQKFFGGISLIIGNKNITFNRDKILWEEDYRLSIQFGCKNITFGRHFLYFMDFLEFDLETNEINLYMNQNSTIITEIEDNNEIKKELLNSSINSNYYIVILFLSFIVFMMSITLAKNYLKNKKIKYYNEYYNIK